MLAIGGLAAACAHGATFDVSTLADSGAGSLREAIAQANASPGPDTITFSVSGTITLTSGLILVTDALAIQGPGPAALTIDGNANNRIFAIVENNAPACPSLTGPADYPVSISGLTLRNGRRNVANSVGGAIYSAKSLAIQNVVFENNRARGGGAVFFSTQYAGQTLTIAGSTFTGNEAVEVVAGTTGTHLGGAVGIGEVCPNARTMPVTVTIADSLFSGNVARAGVTNARGGGLAIFSEATVTIDNSRFVGNRSLPPGPGNPGTNAQGGAMSVRAGSLTLRNSEIADNESDVGGGLAFYNDIDARQTFQDRMVVQLINTTVSDNRAYSSPAAIFAFANVDLRIYNSSIVGNRSDTRQTGGVAFNTGATVPPSAANALPPTLALESSVLWSAGGIRDIAKNSTNMAGALAVPANNSLVGRLCDAVCGAGPISLSGTGNVGGVDPLLGPLAFNGGLTRTRVPQLGSPVVDAGSNVLALATDQRLGAYPRTIGAAPDMGATEYAFTAQCEGFADVAGNSPFCPSVAWMKNRGVTTGCGGGSYCPSPDVSRLAMAAFMTRLGTALSGQAISVVSAPGMLDFALAPVVCATAPIASAPAPRRAVVDMVLSGTAGAPSFSRARVVVSEDNGVTWDDVQFYWTRATFLPGAWRSVHGTSQHDVEAGKTLRYAIRVDSGSPPAASGVLDSTCRLRVRLENSSGFTPL